MLWKNRIIGEGVEAPDQLLANPRNWRIHSEYQQNALRGVLEQVGFVQRVIVNQRTGHMVDGHARVTLAMREGQPGIPVLYVDLTDEEEALILATLDPIAALAGTDMDQLAELLEGVDVDDPGVLALLDNLKAATIIPDDVPPAPGAEAGGCANPDVCPSCGAIKPGRSGGG